MFNKILCNEHICRSLQYGEFSVQVNVFDSPAGLYKIPYFLSLSVLGKNIKLCRGEGNIMAVGKNRTWKKGKGEVIGNGLPDKSTTSYNMLDFKLNKKILR